MTDPRILGERYTRAIHSSDLEAAAERRVDVDYLIAAGMVKDGLGVKLYRLASEWDLAAGDYRLAHLYMRAVELQAMQVQRNARRFPTESEVRLKEAGQLMAQARADAVTAKALALARLKTLREAADAVGDFARLMAIRQRFAEPNAVVNTLAAKALQLWLDAVCSACRGRGFNGGFNGPKIMCTACGNTGRAHWQLSKREPHAAFIRTLLADMDLKAHRVEQTMRRFLRSNG